MAGLRELPSNGTNGDVVTTVIVELSYENGPRLYGSFFEKCYNPSSRLREVKCRVVMK